MNRPEITRAARRQADGSRTDGFRTARLPFPAMGFHVDLPAVNHPKVTSDADGLPRLFLTDYRKALSIALNEKKDFHDVVKLCNLRATGGLRSTSSVLFQKNRVPTSFENKYSVVKSIESLPSLNCYPFSLTQRYKDFLFRQIFNLAGIVVMFQKTEYLFLSKINTLLMHRELAFSQTAIVISDAKVEIISISTRINADKHSIFEESNK